MAWKRASLLTLSLCAFALSGCYARSLPLAPLPEPAPGHISPALSRVVGIRSGKHGDNVALVHAGRVAERFARRLFEAGVFSDVIHPLTDRSPARPDVVIELSVSSTHDLHPLKNLAADIAAGLSLLLLQPVLPTTWDLSVEITASGHGGGAGRAEVFRTAARSRFEFTWLRASQESIEHWHRETSDRAINAMVARVAEHYAPAAQPAMQP